MILGMSNTFQQLVTALKIEDIRFALSKFGDSRVGTNSPFSINHKRDGKLNSWACWILLIVTSLPLHFLANSLIGPSTVHTTNMKVQFRMFEVPLVPDSEDDTGIPSNNLAALLCWSTLRTGRFSFANNWEILQHDTARLFRDNKQPTTVTVVYSHHCNKFVLDMQQTGATNYSTETMFPIHDWYLRIDECTLGFDKDNGGVGCVYSDYQDAQCRLNSRMIAAFILAGCLTVKATYMVLVNLCARGSIKTTCLTFGDVIVAAAADPPLRVRNECMVNASDHCHFSVVHRCHKHCNGEVNSKTGDELGHCQSCKRFNHINKSASLLQPQISSKVKKSLISNLGHTALTQMIILSLCSTFSLAISIFLAFITGSGLHLLNSICHDDPHGDDRCKLTNSQRLDYVSGGWGGHDNSKELASFSGDSLANEFLAMIVANFAQAVHSFIYLLLIYNISLISQEHAWGKLEHNRRRLRCTIDRGHQFEESYLLQLPKRIIYPLMAYSVLIHWILGESLQIKEYVWRDVNVDPPSEHSYYAVVYAAYPVWFATALILCMTIGCWWAFTYKRQGFIPQMFGSIRVCCAAATELDYFPEEGVMWGDLGKGRTYRHAGFSAGEVGKIVPHELYAGRDGADFNGYHADFARESKFKTL